MKEEIDFSAFSPTDYRYAVDELRDYLSEEAFVNYKAKVEAAVARAFEQRGILKAGLCDEIVETASKVNAADVYEEEKRTKHDIRALVNVIRSGVSDEAKPFVHLSATSYDVVNTANALRYKDAVMNVIIPDMVELERTWIDLARREKDTLQIGRTHGQHAEPITFGFGLAQYVNRWGSQILNVQESSVYTGLCIFASKLEGLKPSFRSVLCTLIHCTYFSPRASLGKEFISSFFYLIIN